VFCYITHLPFYTYLISQIGFLMHLAWLVVGNSSAVCWFETSNCLGFGKNILLPHPSSPNYSKDKTSLQTRVIEQASSYLYVTHVIGWITQYFVEWSQFGISLWTGFDISKINLNTKMLHQGNTIAMWFISARMGDCACEHSSHAWEGVRSEHVYTNTGWFIWDPCLGEWPLEHDHQVRLLW